MAEEKILCELCGKREADIFGHIHFIGRPHVMFWCLECDKKLWKGEYGRFSAVSFYKYISDRAKKLAEGR